MDKQAFSNDEERIAALLPALKRSLEERLSPQLRKKLNAEDLVQETFLRALKSPEDIMFESDQMLLAWLRQLATRIALSAIRAASSDPTAFSVEHTELASELFNSNDLTPSELVRNEENRQILALCIGKLSEQHREILEYRYFNKLNFADIAIRLDCTEPAARGLHRNALQAIRRALGDVSRFFSTQ